MVLKCGFSHICELRATNSVDTVTTVRALLDWVSRYGIMEFIVSDGPSSFKNAVLKALAKTFVGLKPERVLWGLVGQCVGKSYTHTAAQMAHQRTLAPPCPHPTPPAP